MEEKAKKFSASRFLSIAASIATVVSVLIIILNKCGSDEKSLLFDETPSNESSFLSINGINGNNTANKYSTFQYGNLNNNKDVYIFFDFRNKTGGTIKDAQAIISYKQDKDKIIITGRLVGENAKEVVGVVFLKNLPKGYWKFEYLNGNISVDDREANGVKCSDIYPELNVPWQTEIYDPNEIIIGDLPFGKHKGWCAQGYVELHYKLVSI